MGSVVVIVLLPVVGYLSGMAVAGEQMLVQALIAQPAVKAFNKAILHGFARCDIAPLNAAILLPLQHRIAGQLRTIVADHHAGIAAMPGNDIQFARYTRP